VFLDAQDWMDDTQLNALWRQVTRTAAPGARVVFRTGGSASPLERRLAPQLLACWETDPAYNRQLHQRDRAAIYGGVHVYIKRT
jgi:S-adenosylmethionine-diacylglycerol 3-amino-3-carboxypropyl transferase